MLRKHRSLAYQKQMLRNLDILAYEQYSEQSLKTPPSFQKAILQMQSTYMRDHQNKQYPLLCDLKQFQKYGPGVYLPFKFLKYLLVVMGILLVFPVINLIVLVLSQDHFVWYNMQTSLQVTTISNINSSNQTLVIALNFTVLFVLTATIFVWKHQQTNQILKCTSKTCLSSQYTAILTKIPNCYSEHDMVQFLQKNYGKIHQIYTVKNYEDDLLKYKEVQIILDQLKTERQIYLRNKGQTGCLNLAELFMSYKQKHSQIVEHIVKDKRYEPTLAFITFQTLKARNSLLQDLQVKFNRCGSKTRKQIELGEQFLYKNQRLQFRSCQLEPNGIIWQNINVPIRQKLIRYSLIWCLLLTFLFISITIFFILAAVQSSLYSDRYDHYTLQQILQIGKPQAIISYCIDLSFSTFNAQPLCQPYFNDYVKYFSLYLIFPLFVTFLKICFAALMKKLVIMRRHKYQFYKIKWQIAIITLFYFIKTALIKWFIYRSFTFGNTHIKMLDIFLPFLSKIAKVIPIQPEHIPLYQSFNKQWVAHASCKTIMIAMLSFNFSILLFYLKSLITRKYRIKLAASQPTGQKMKQMLKGQQFDLEFMYAELLALFLFCMLYFSCSPIIYILVYISLLLVYWVAKYSLLRLCSIPPVYSHSIHDTAFKIILIGLMINSIVSPLYYGNSDLQVSKSFFQCWLTYWYYTLNFFIILGFITCQAYLIHLYSLIKNQLMNMIYCDVHQEHQLKKMNVMKSEERGLKPYFMHDSQQYKKVLKILYTLNRNQAQNLGFCMQRQIIQIRQTIEQPKNQFRLFSQLYCYLNAHIEKQSEDYKQNKQKYDIYRNQFSKMKQQVQMEIQQERKIVQLHSIVNSRLIHLNKQAQVLQKLQSVFKKSTTLSNSNNKAEDMEQCLGTDIRIV